MGREANIQWCDSTVNGTSGCDGCELWNKQVRTCYAGILHETRLAPGFARTRPDLYARDFSEVRIIPGRFAEAAKWPDLSGIPRIYKPWLNGWPRCIFVGDLGDFLSEGVPYDFLERELLGAMLSQEGKRHVWMLLTKRPSRLAALSNAWNGLPDNCIAMTTITDQKTANLRIPELLRVKAKRRAVSAEPLLGPIDIEETKGWWGGIGIEVLIAGGASGNGAQPCQVEWFDSLRKGCSRSGVKFFLKQLGSNCHTHNANCHDWPDDTRIIGEGDGAAAGRICFKHSKGGDCNEWPDELRIREWPSF